MADATLRTALTESEVTTLEQKWDQFFAGELDLVDLEQDELEGWEE